MSLLLAGIWLFAAGMLPLGFMLGSSCSECCPQSPSCGVCEQGSLPETITVILNGFADQTGQGPDLALLEFSSSTHGSGAAGKVTSPSETAGPILGTEITSGGGDYARIARFAPALEVAGHEGEFSFSTAEKEGADPPLWEIVSVTILDPGTGWVDGQLLPIVPEPGTDTFQNEAASVTVYVGREAPEVTADVTSEAGTGASLTVSLGETTAADSRDAWRVASIEIDNGGEDYEVGDEITFTIAEDATIQNTPTAAVSGIDDDGAIIGITLTDFAFGGVFYRSNDQAELVVVNYGGEWYREDRDAPAIVAEVTVTVNQKGPTKNLAAGAVLEAVIDDDFDSPTFGEIVGVNVISGGDNYLAWQTINTTCCADHFNNLPAIVLQKSGPCTYSKTVCGITLPCTTTITVEYRGPDDPASVQTNCGPILYSTTAISDCSEFAFTAQNQFGATAIITAGGEYDENAVADGGTGRCILCCQGTEDPPQEVEIDVLTNYATTPLPPLTAGAEGVTAATVVLARQPACFGYWAGGFLIGGFIPIPVQVFLSPYPPTDGFGGNWTPDLYRVEPISPEDGSCFDPFSDDCRYEQGKACGTTVVVGSGLFQLWAVTNCAATIPICEPASGTYWINRADLTDPFGYPENWQFRLTI